MPGRDLDIRRTPGQRPKKYLSSSVSDHVACPVADGGVQSAL